MKMDSRGAAEQTEQWAGEGGTGRARESSKWTS